MFAESKPLFYEIAAFARISIIAQLELPHVINGCLGFTAEMALAAPLDWQATIILTTETQPERVTPDSPIRWITPGLN
jgi:hypothetical protein